MYYICISSFRLCIGRKNPVTIKRAVRLFSVNTQIMNTYFIDVKLILEKYVYLNLSEQMQIASLFVVESYLPGSDFLFFLLL